MEHIAGQRVQSQPTPSVFSRSNIVVVSALAILALMSCWAIFLYFGMALLIPSDSSLQTESPNNTNSQTTNSQNMTAATEVAAPAVAYEDAEQAFVLDLQRSELQGRVEATKACIANARKSVNQFQARIDGLQTSDTGRRVATPDAALKIDFLTQFLKRMDFADAENEIRNVEQSMMTTDQPLVNFGQFVEKLIAVENDLEDSNRRCEAANKAVDQLLSENRVVQPITLSAAIQHLEQSKVLAVRTQVDEKLASDRANMNARLQSETKRQTDLKRELEQAKNEYGLLRENSRVEIESSERSIQNAKRELATRKSKTIKAMRTAYPDVRDLLAPITTPGYRQPGASGSLEITSEKRPMSYSGLLRKRALEDSKKGRELLFYMVQPSNAFGKLNDRPLGGFPAYRNHYDIDTAEVQAKLQRAQAFLRNYGEAMVEAELLSP